MASNSCEEGHGKSSTANTISGSKEIESSSWSESYTKTSKLSEVFTFDDRRVEVVDTPGIFDTENDHKHLKALKELIKISLMTTPGFHVIALVLRPDRFTREIQQTLDVFYNWFGGGIEKFACVILTHVGSEREKNEYLNRGRHEKLSKLLTKCKNRIACFDNNGSSELKSSQRRKFMELVFQMDVDNEGECFNNFMYDAIKRYAFERGKVNISKDSMLLFRSACQDWSRSYRREVLDTLGIDSFDDPESSTEETVPMRKGNLVVFDENNERIPNEIQQNESSTSLHNNGEVDEINEQPTTVPVASETSPPASVSIQSQHTVIYRRVNLKKQEEEEILNTIREDVYDQTRYRNSPQTYTGSDNNDDERSRDNHNVGDQILHDNDNYDGSRDSDYYDDRSKMQKAGCIVI